MNGYSADRVVRTKSISRRLLPLTLPYRIVYVIAQEQRIPPIVRWSFLLFAFSLPFENIELPILTGVLTLSKIAGVFFFVVYFFYYNSLSQKRSFPDHPPAVWWFMGYVAIFTVKGLFISEEYVSPFLIFLSTWVQLVGFFWIAPGLLKEEKMARSVLLTYAIASAILAIGMVLRVPGLSPEIARDNRETVLGMNEGTTSFFMVVALTVLIGLRLNIAFKHFVSKTLLLVLAVPVLVAMVRTGTRVEIMAFIIGCLLYLLPSRWSKRKGTAIILTMLGVVALVYMVSHNPYVLERWKQVYYEGSLSTRETIYPTAIGMILERPILGWDPVSFRFELGKRLGIPSRNAHNFVLDLLLQVGIVGTIPFLVGLWLCGRAAWSARRGRLGLLPLVLLLVTLITNMAATYTERKAFWLVLSLAVAAAYPATKRQNKRPARLLVSRSPKSPIRLNRHCRERTATMSVMTPLIS